MSAIARPKITFAAFGIAGALAWCAAGCAPDGAVKYRAVTGPVAGKRYFEVRCQEMNDCYTYAREACQQDWKIVRSMNEPTVEGAAASDKLPDYQLMVECVGH